MSRAATKRATKRRHQKKLRASGFQQIGFWIPKALLDSAKVRARMLNVPAQVVVAAAIDLGVRIMTTSEILASERQYRALVGYPCIPHYEGAPWDKEKNAGAPALARGRAIRKEKLKAKRAA